MAHTTVYDILELSEDLKKAGIPEKAISSIIKFEKAKDDATLNTLATKLDIKILDDKIKTILWVIGVGFTVLGLMNASIVLMMALK